MNWIRQVVHHRVQSIQTMVIAKATATMGNEVILSIVGQVRKTSAKGQPRRRHHAAPRQSNSQSEHGDQIQKSTHRTGNTQETRANQTLKDNWDSFNDDGLSMPLRGFEFSIDTSEPPRHGPHEERVITKLALELEKNRLAEDAREDLKWY
jgi:hypothetical protein